MPRIHLDFQPATTDQKYATVGDNTVDDAIMDRLMHNTHRFNLKEEPMQKQSATLAPS